MPSLSVYRSIIALLVAGTFAACNTQQQTVVEAHRPTIHFTPAEKWMNDPNGMVYHKNTYHLFYQYYPDSTVWGPMHWGHATSSDLVSWQHKPVALFPDSLGYIFSGSAVVDFNNSSGLAKQGEIPLVAIFTHHDPAGEKAGRIDYQYQSIAYSLDDGKTWTKYPGNPVLKNPGIKDFRDPKVSWHEESKKWIMTLATLDRITFYSSPNLIEWTKLSEFGQSAGAHGGVWECPDLFSFDIDGKKLWVLLVSINPGGPNGGSATQYFVGNFDGTAFTPIYNDTLWVDYGPDNYAGVTFFNTGERKIFIGWMNNWQYANLVPTDKWRGATTLPRDLSLRKVGERYYLASQLSKEVDQLAGKAEEHSDVQGNQNFNAAFDGPVRIDLSTAQLDSFAITLSNNKDEQTIMGYDKLENRFFIDRRRSGKVDFEKGFAAMHYAPRIAAAAGSNITVMVDRASVEFFGDDGISVMTSTFFPTEDYNKITISGVDNIKFEKVIITPYRAATETKNDAAKN